METKNASKLLFQSRCLSSDLRDRRTLVGSMLTRSAIGTADPA